MRKRFAPAWTDRLPEDVLDQLSHRQERKLDRLADKGKHEKLLKKFEKMLDRLGIDNDLDDLRDDGVAEVRGGRKGKADWGVGDGWGPDSGCGGKGKGGGKKGRDDGDPKPDPDTVPGTDPGADPGIDTGGSDGPFNTVDSSGLYSTYLSGKGDLGVISAYNVELKFNGAWTVAQQSAALAAAEMISTLVTGDEADHRRVDDLRITLSAYSIDGAYGTAARASLSGVRAEGDLPWRGRVLFDSGDMDRLLAAGTLADLAFHEMLHVMGFGAQWDDMGLIAKVNGQLRFTGAAATAAWQTEYAGIAAADPDSHRGVPVEMDGGSGTAGVHWDEMLFRREIMTGYINRENAMSATTLAALEDMGFDTIFDPADPLAPVPQLDALLVA